MDAVDRTGPFKTNWVEVKDGYFLASGYALRRFDQTEVGPTGYHKVLGVIPLCEESKGPRFLVRWDKVDKTLDCDLVDRQDNVVQPDIKPYGHNSTDVGGQRFPVELGLSAANIVFRGIVAISLGFGRRPKTGTLTIT